MNSITPNLMTKFTDESYKLGYIHGLDMVRVLIEKEMKRKGNNGRIKRTARKSPVTARARRHKTATR